MKGIWISVWAVIFAIGTFAVAYFLADYDMGQAVLTGVIGALVVLVVLALRQRKRGAG